MQFNRGDLVRLINDPGRQGVIRGDRDRGGILYYRVQFPDSSSFQPADTLELVEESDDAYEMLQNGQFGRAIDLRRNLSNILLSGKIASLVYSMDATNTKFYAYQYKPVLSFLENPSNGLLLADEVGLGKTIEAGLIWTELRARLDARRLLVVCPAMLCDKWKSELNARFGVNAEIMNAEELTNALKKDKNSIPDGTAIICSIGGLRPPKESATENDRGYIKRAALARLLEESAINEPVIDLTIIDEAHNMRNPESQSAKLGLLLRDASEKLLLLSATPINLKSDDLYHLLKLVDPDTFSIKEFFPSVLSANEPLVAAREKVLDLRSKSEEINQLLSSALDSEFLQGNKQLTQLVDSDIENDYLANKADRIRLADRIERINLLNHVVTRTRKAEVTEWRVVRQPYSEFIPFNDDSNEEEFYTKVTAVIKEYADDSDINDGFLLASPQRMLASSMYAAAKSWQKKTALVNEEIYNEFGIESIDGKGVSPLISYITDRAISGFDIELLRKHDSKYEKFRSIIIKHLEENPDEKIVVFSTFRGTLSYLSERLSQDGVTSKVLVGGMRENKQDIIDNFRKSSDIRVLLSSEVASEGVDIQFCRVLVNYDLPWNPMKVEQRIGRLDRIGQKSESIKIWNLFHKDTIDHRIYCRLYERLHIFTRALGGLDAILGDEIKKLTSDLLRLNLTPEEEEIRIQRTSLAIEKIKQSEDKLEKEASHLIAHGGYILEQVRAAHQFKKRITDRDLIIYVKDYLEKYCQGHIFQQQGSDSNAFEIRLPAETAAKLDDFVRNNNLTGKTRLSSGDTLKCVFQTRVKLPGQQVEVINQFNPFVRFIGQDLATRGDKYVKLLSIEINHHDRQELTPGHYVFAVSLWSFEGMRTEEELKARVVSLTDDKLLSLDESWDIVNAARLVGTDYLAASAEMNLDTVEQAIDACAITLEQDFVQSRDERIEENSDRVSFQVSSAKKYRDRQISSREMAIEKLRQSDNYKMINLNIKHIESIKRKYDTQEEKLKNRNDLRSSSLDVCYGVVIIK